MHTKSTTPHRPQHQVGHARREYDAAPGQATADLADSPTARGALVIVVILAVIFIGGTIINQAAQHPAAATLTAGTILTTLTWRWTR